MKLASKKRIRWTISLLILPFVIYLSAEQILLAKIRSDLHRHSGDDYAIIALHIGGENNRAPSLFKMLYWVYEYNFTEDYKPMGTGHFTGKHYYLTALFTDNQNIRDCHWSFRRFGLQFDDDLAPWDVIDHLPPDKASLYRFDAGTRKKRKGLWLVGENFNHQAIRFYYRGTLPDFPEQSGTGKYEVAGVLDDDVIDRAVPLFVRRVADGDRVNVSKSISYPIQVYVNGKRREIRHELDFLKYYHQIFTPEFKMKIQQADPQDLFHNWQGVMLGHGEIWFGSTGSVIAINNIPTQ